MYKLQIADSKDKVLITVTSDLKFWVANKSFKEHRDMLISMIEACLEVCTKSSDKE